MLQAVHQAFLDASNPEGDKNHESYYYFAWLLGTQAKRHLPPDQAAPLLTGIIYSKDSPIHTSLLYFIHLLFPEQQYDCSALFKKIEESCAVATESIERAQPSMDAIHHVCKTDTEEDEAVAMAVAAEAEVAAAIIERCTELEETLGEASDTLGEGKLLPEKILDAISQGASLVSPILKRAIALHARYVTDLASCLKQMDEASCYREAATKAFKDPIRGLEAGGLEPAQRKPTRGLQLNIADQGGKRKRGKGLKVTPPPKTEVIEIED